MNKEELKLHQSYQSWKSNLDDKKAYKIAYHILSNLESKDTYRPEFAISIMERHLKENLPIHKSIWRSWFIWFTKFEQLHNNSNYYSKSLKSIIKLFIECAIMNAYMKALYWSLENNTDDVAKYHNIAYMHYGNVLKELNIADHNLKKELILYLNDENWTVLIKNDK